MSLAQALMKLYPTASIDDFRIVYDVPDGSRARIAYWNNEKLGPQPALDDQRLIDADAVVEQQITQEKAAKEALATASTQMQQLDLNSIVDGDKRIPEILRWLVRRELSRL